MKELIRLGIVEHLVENFGVKVTQRMVFDGQYHTHDFYELEFILNGQIRTEINGKIHELSEGSLVLLTPSDVHKYIGLDKPAELINLAFISKEIEYNSFAVSVLFGKSIVCRLSEESKSNVLFLIQKIKAESMNDELLSKRYVSLLLSCLMIELKRIKNEQGIYEDEQINETVRSAIIYIRNNFKEQITLEDVANIMNVSTVYASKLIQENLGCGFKEYLMELRLEYATGLLTNTKETISDISYFAGYNSVSYFSRGFKKKYGVSPAEYRKIQKCP